MSLYRQLWLAIVISTLLALGGSLLASLFSARAYLESQLSIKNTDNATALALSLSQGNPDAVMADLVVASLFDSGHYELIRITDPMGGLIAERIAPAGDLDAPAWFVDALPVHALPGVAQISSGWKQFGAVTLVSHSRFAYGALWKSAYEMVLALALAGLVGGYLGSLVLWRLRGPLNAVIEQAQAITQRRFVAIELPSVPELRQLAIAMNTMVARLKAMFDDEAVRLEAVRREANFDALTGLANRSYFMAQLGQTLVAEDAAGGTLVLVRLCDLSGLNRRRGRADADQCLQRGADTLQQCAQRWGAGSVARLNGSDFALLLGAQVDGASCCQDLMHVLVPTLAPYFEGVPTASMAHGRFHSGVSLAELLASVDAALAQAELDGTDAVREAAMTGLGDMPRSASQWASMIQRALDKRWLRLISFPVVELSGRLSHRECPLRLMADENGEWLAAGRFWPFAERLRLTPALDLAAVSLGLQELARQPALNGLAINLSASSLEDSRFVERLLALLAEHAPASKRLWLEMTENGVLAHLEQFKPLCHKLKRLGCRVGLEHFGHQFSQIGLLHELGLDYLKVDASFIRGIDSHVGNAAFLKGLTGIAHNIGLQVLAEGVTSDAEFEALRALGFDGATGPAIEAPVDS
ncbi:MAG: diguanylate cyclase [Burkholderiales bacterium RIFCSPLOWO2_12_FULL_61_40]|nr:MAG: diguanylate cyclase [Burkholderiales bacterium RIFCSPLOWO2_12_FULL_61_40]